MPFQKDFRDQFSSRSVYRSYYFLIYLVGLAFLFGAYRGARGAFSEPYVQLPELFWSTVLTLAGVYCFFIPYRMKAFWVYADRVEIRRFTGGLLQTVYRKDITGWHEGFFTGGKVPDWKELSIFHRDGVFVISSSHIENYAAFLVLHKGTRFASAPGLRAGAYRFIIGFTLAGFCFVAITYGQFSTWSLRPRLETFAAVIAEDPVVNKGSRTGYSMNLQIRGLDEFRFRISGDRFGQFAASEFVEDVHAGDSVFLGLERDDYLAKIRRQQPLRFRQKHDNYEFIDVYGLSGSRFSYLAPENAVAATRNHSATNAIICAGLGIVCFGLAITVYTSIRRRLRLNAST